MFWRILFAVLIVGFVSHMLSWFRTPTAPADHGTPTFKEGENSVVFIGHATALVHINGTNVLTDPNFNDWSTILHRSRLPGLKPEELPDLDAIVISHSHRDHMDGWTLKQLPKDIPILASKGNAEYLHELGFRDVRELETWETATIKGVRITATPAKHSGARNSAWADLPKAFGYLIEGDKTVYFAGDTGFFDGFKEIGNRSKIDLALLPIGAYRPRWVMKRHHMSPEDATSAMDLLGAKDMVPIHWGSFRMALDGVYEPKEVLMRLLGNGSLKEKVHILENGQSYTFKN